MKLSEFFKTYEDVEIDECKVCEVFKIQKRKGKQRVPKIDEKYWFVGNNGRIFRCIYQSDIIDNFRISKRNFYQTEQQCEFALDMHNFCQELSFEPDWSDGEQEKYLIGLFNGRKSVEAIKASFRNSFAPYYYPTEAAAQEVVDKYSFEELAEYYGRV